MITALTELFPFFARRRWLIVIITCTIFYIVSLPFACPVSTVRHYQYYLTVDKFLFFQGGIYLFELFQEYTANTSLVLVGFFEVVTVAYIYGLFFFNNFFIQIHFRIQSIYERCSIDVGQASSQILPFYHMVYHSTTTHTCKYILSVLVTCNFLTNAD